MSAVPLATDLDVPLQPPSSERPAGNSAHCPPVLRGEKPLDWRQVVAVARHGARLELADSVWAQITNARAIVDHIVERGERAYGISTGLGALSDIALQGPQLAKLSRNTLLSHACGVGPILKVEQTRAIICAAINNYAHGRSGISPAVVQSLLDLLNHDITPCVPSQGSVGYLTHMAHIGIALLGIGQVSQGARLMSAAQALNQAGLAVVELQAKDGLSLVNGTPCMTGLASLALADASNLAQWADIIGAMSFEALRGQIDAFDEAVLSLKVHPGVQTVGHNLRTLLAGSACRDQLKHAERQIDAELASVTDNPLVVGTPEAYRVLSQANPHGESLAMAADLMCIAVAELAGVAERRLDRLINPLVSGLPAFLVSQPGVNSGMMITQYVAAALVGENRHLAQPAVVDNFVTSALQEDHLSLGTGATLKLLKVIDNTTQVLAIEYLLAAQAFEFLQPLRLGAGTDRAWRLLRGEVPAYDEDRWLAPDIERAAQMVRRPAFEW
jgi:histidine ammonia-lyase